MQRRWLHRLDCRLVLLPWSALDIQQRRCRRDERLHAHRGQVLYHQRKQTPSKHLHVIRRLADPDGVPGRITMKNERGAAVVELAFALPVLVLIFFITTDFARVFRTSIELTNASRAGAQYGSMDL